MYYYEKVPLNAKGWIAVLVTIIFFVIGFLLFAGCDTINYYDPHAGCTEVWVLEGFQWNEENEMWTPKPSHRPKKLIWKQDWDCNGQD